MAKQNRHYICNACGAVYGRWQGKCDSCNEWNQIIDEPAPIAPPLGSKANARRRNSGKKSAGIDLQSLKGQSAQLPRLTSSMKEFDRVVGGGLVAGQAVLIGGDPGIGKSTLLLQICAALSEKATTVYISGEEAVDQIRLRASRLGVIDKPVSLSSAINIADIQAAMERLEPPAIIVIDSIQTMFVEEIEAAPGSVAQVRASAQELIRTAKKTGVSLILVGHVTKDGAIAGPRVLEHMVDSVLYFEGEGGYAYRLLRSIKNRFGPANEIGVFDMTGDGLREVSNPSQLFLSTRQKSVPGAAVFAAIEGTRPMLVEFQALIAPSPLATPRRAVVGWDHNRLAMILAVLETRGGLQLAGRDVYLNVAGGLRITEPAADLAVAAAIISALLNKHIDVNCLFFGEIGLSGEVRSVSQSDIRCREGEKLGFESVISPPVKSDQQGPSTLRHHYVTSITELIDAVNQG